MSNPIGEILSNRIGLRHGYQFRENDFTENGIQVIKIGNVTDDGLKLDTDVSFVSADRVREFENIIIKNGDILMSLTGNIGRVVEVQNLNGKILFQNYRVGVFYPLDEDVYKPFIKWVLSSEAILRQLSNYSNQSAQANFGKQDLDKLRFVFPKHKNQRQIAKILSTADAVIEKTQAAIAKYKAIKQGMLQDLFTRGIDLNTNKLRPRYENAPELYKESKLGWIPRQWEEIKLGKCGTFRKGGNIPKYSLSHNGVGCILYGQLYTTFHETVKKVYSKVPNQIVENMTPLKYGAILFAGSGETHEEIGKCVALLINDEEVYAGGDVVVLDLYDEYFKPFFGYYLNFQPIQSQKSKFGQGSSVIHIYANHLSSIDLALPQRNEQQRIFEVIDQLNNKLQTEQTYLQKMQSLKKGLMEDLLSGKKQVKVAEEVLTQSEN